MTRNGLRHPDDGHAHHLPTDNDQTFLDLDLVQVVERWPHLTSEIRASILAMIREAPGPAS